jgi:DNA-binding MarR family transcriptional regulator
LIATEPKLINVVTDVDRLCKMNDSIVLETNIADKISRLRAWENANLPIAGTILGYDVVVLLARSIETGGRVPSSTLYGELNYSEAALRLHIQRLQREGFVLRSRDGEDGRNRSIVLTDSFRAIWASYTEIFQELFEISPNSQHRTGSSDRLKESPRFREGQVWEEPLVGRP